ncbi:hypothetical protein Tco_0276083 [Tanacetum coccineum]
MTSEREMTPPPGFLTLTPIPGPNANELTHITTSTFTTRTPKNTPLINHESTSANPDPMISPAFVEANYKVLESLLWERRRQRRNEGKPLQFSTRSLQGPGDRERVVEFEDAPNRDESKILGLREEQRIFGFVHGLKTRSLVEFLSTDLQTTYKGLMEKTYTWIEVK